MSFDPATLRYNDAGLIPCIAQDAESHEVLMMAWMNAEAVARTLETGRVTYWSRSRQAFWVKGESSGHTQELVDFRLDCDRDCLLVLVNQTGQACHTNRRTCFYTAVRDGDETELMRPVEYAAFRPVCDPASAGRVRAPCWDIFSQKKRQGGS